MHQNQLILGVRYLIKMTYGKALCDFYCNCMNFMKKERDHGKENLELLWKQGHREVCWIDGQCENVTGRGIL